MRDIDANVAPAVLVQPPRSISLSCCPRSPCRRSMIIDEDISQVAQERERYAIVQREYLEEKQKREMFVPTKDDQVKALLRSVEEPAILFGESPPERRERLRALMVDREAKGNPIQIPDSYREELTREEMQDRLFYTDGLAALRAARLKIAHFSLLRANDRRRREAELEQLDAETYISSLRRRWSGPPEGAPKDLPDNSGVEASIKAMATVTSQFGDDRPVQACRFSPDASRIATASWTGECRIWSVPHSKVIQSLRGHRMQAHDIAWHPRACLGQPTGAVNLASVGSDGVCCLWALEGSAPLCRLEGHTQRLAQCSFHPMGDYVATTSFDRSWRLWDLATGECLLSQEGHSRPAYALDFHGDGSLLLTGGRDAHVMVWDLRTGQKIWTAQGHVKDVLSVAMAPNGYEFASGSEDHSVRVWDLRKRECVQPILAHCATVSRVCYQKGDGDFLVSASYDNTCKFWCAHDFGLVRILGAHESRIMGLDLSSDGQYMATSCFDRTWKLWAVNPERALDALTKEGLPQQASAREAPVRADGKHDEGVLYEDREAEEEGGRAAEQRWTDAEEAVRQGIELIEEEAEGDGEDEDEMKQDVDAGRDQ